MSKGRKHKKAYNLPQRQLESVYFESERWVGSYDVNDCNMDVEFHLSDGTQWVAAFFTYQNINSLREKNQRTGEELGGLYFCSLHMILIEDLRRETILKVLNHMISENEVELYCGRLEPADID